jgi:RimJ/RimL family protein N-acetyltransferase
MSEAVAAVLAWAAPGWGRRLLTSGHFADNPASGRVLVKAGFLYTGEVGDRYSIARGETAATRMMIWLA